MKALLFSCSIFALLLGSSCSIKLEQISLPADLMALQGVVDGAKGPQAWLGLEVELLHPEGLADLDDLDDLDSLDLQPGVRIRKVARDSPAADAGLKVGDVLLQYGGHDVDDPERLSALLAAISLPTTTKLQYQRGTEVRESTADVKMRVSTGPGRVLYQVERAYLRAAFSDSASGGHAQIERLWPNSPLRLAGAQEGDLLISFDGKRVGSAAGFGRNCAVSLKPGQVFELEVEHAAGNRQLLEVHAWDPGRVLTEFTIWPIIRWEHKRAEGRKEFAIGDLFFFSVFNKTTVGAEVEYSILGFFSWRTGEAVLESEFSFSESADA